MEKFRIYLAGPCQFVSDEGKAWRDDAEKKLATIAEWTSRDIEVINPLKYFTYKNVASNNNHQIKKFYMSRIKDCDLVLCNCEGTNHSAGTAQECQYAVDHEIPIIGFGMNDSYSWIRDVDCQVVFETITEALDYIRDYYL